MRINKRIKAIEDHKLAEVVNAANELIEASGCVRPFGEKIDVQSTRRAMKYMAAFDNLKKVVKKARA